MESIHEYRVEAIDAGGRNGVVHAEGILPAISFSPPPEFQGEVGRWTPEHLLVAAVASCFISTFEGMAQTSRLEFDSLRLAAEGVLTKQDSGWRFTEIRLRPAVIVRNEEDHDRAVRLLEKAEKSCLVARSLQCKVVLFSAVKIEEELFALASKSLKDLRRENDSNR
jgi:peroxiredoxin-like protein